MMMIKYSWDAVMPAYFVKFQIPFFKWKLFFFPSDDPNFEERWKEGQMPVTQKLETEPKNLVS